MREFIYQAELIEKVNSKKRVVERFLGFTDRPAPKVIQKKIDQELENFPKLLDVFYNYVISGDEINMIYSVGPKFEDRIDLLVEDGQAMNAMIVDKIGVICLDVIRSLIVKEVKAKYQKTPYKYFYPGGKDYGIDLQAEIHQMMDTGYIKINDYHQLYPVKSVALRAKLKDAEADGEEKEGSPCDACDFKCDMRGAMDE